MCARLEAGAVPMAGTTSHGDSALAGACRNVPRLGSEGDHLVAAGGARNQWQFIVGLRRRRGGSYRLRIWFLPARLKKYKCKDWEGNETSGEGMDPLAGVRNEGDGRLTAVCGVTSEPWPTTGAP